MVMSVTGNAPEVDVPVTVLLPVRNGVRWLSACLESLNSQTYGAFEILMVDDLSSDGSLEVAREVAGDRLRIVRGSGRGLARALALGVEAADTSLIVRMDADDLAHPERLKNQVKFLLQTPDAVMVGSNVNVIDERGKYLTTSHLPLRDSGIRMRMLVGNPFAHSSVAFRREAVLSVGNYWSPDEKPFPEDLHLWRRLIRLGSVANLREPLINYRVNTDGQMSVNARAMRHQTAILCFEYLKQDVLPVEDCSEIQEAWHQIYCRQIGPSCLKRWRIATVLFRSRLRASWLGCWGGLRPHDYWRVLAPGKSARAEDLDLESDTLSCRT